MQKYKTFLQKLIPEAFNVGNANKKAFNFHPPSSNTWHILADLHILSKFFKAFVLHHYSIFGNTKTIMNILLTQLFRVTLILWKETFQDCPLKSDVLFF